MALSQDYTFICEHARMEMGGKFIVIGLFPNGIGTPMIPFPLPVLTVFMALRADTPGAYSFKGKLSQLDTGFVLAKAEGKIQVGQAGPVVMPIPLQNLQFKAFGSYTWSLDIAGQEEPFVTQFQVTHVPMQPIRFA